MPAVRALKSTRSSASVEAPPITGMVQVGRPGWEGITIAPPGTLALRASLLAVHQVRPRRLGLFDLETLTQRHLWRLPRSARKALGDLNDVTIDARTGHVLVLSGKPGRVAELALKGPELVHLATWSLETDDADVPEGITFDDDGRLWVVTDGQGWLGEYAALSVRPGVTVT